MPILLMSDEWVSEGRVVLRASRAGRRVDAGEIDISDQQALIGATQDLEPLPPTVNQLAVTGRDRQGHRMPPHPGRRWGAGLRHGARGHTVAERLEQVRSAYN